MKKGLKKQAISTALLCLVSVLLAVILAGILCPEREGETYPFDRYLGSYNPYEQQFDAFMKGQLHIDILPNEALLELENPYDPSQRYGVDYLWDRALYDGKYFSYFGIAPIITLYYPYYFIAGELPADDTVSAVFAVMTALFFSMAAVKLWAMLGKKTPMWLLWLLTLGGLFTTQIFLAMRGVARFYYIATVSGMAFLSAFVWLLLCGISGCIAIDKAEDHVEPTWKRPLIFAFAGLAYGLCFLSRFNMALLAAFFIIPMLWFFVVRENGGFRAPNRVVVELIALALPVIIAVSAQLILNYARFDNAFEFGTTYQLTVSDVSKNRLRLGDIGYAAYHYFFQPLSYTEDFPNASLFYTALEEYGHYIYVDTGMGLFSIPFMWLIFASVFIFADRAQSIGRKVTLAATIFGMIFVAWLDFCLGGVIFRYTCDLTVVGAFVSLCIAFLLSERRGLGAGMNAALTMLVLASVFVSVTLAFSENVNLGEYSEALKKSFDTLIFK